ncbi:MAG: sugar transferase [candidate division KSB1 bacterium]|nr:sugar transferase [candidate division KSB1 bacterium]
MTKISIWFNELVKRLADIFIASVGLLVGLPLFLVLPILIKLDSKGPVFYTQLRVGQERRKRERRRQTVEVATNRRTGERRQSEGYGKPFTIYKFRTMRDQAEKKCGPVWACDNDPRITPLGRVLRATNLDELPQLINVLRGDMSFVGPRPERPFFVNQLEVLMPGYRQRLKVKPGITGLAQIHLTDDNSLQVLEQKLNYDLEYCKNGNLKSYTRILLKTLTRAMTGKLRI